MAVVAATEADALARERSTQALSLGEFEALQEAEERDEKTSTIAAIGIVCEKIHNPFAHGHPKIGPLHSQNHKDGQAKQTLCEVQ